jgi:hypothetical protein
LNEKTGNHIDKNQKIGSDRIYTNLPVTNNFSEYTVRFGRKIGTNDTPGNY